jgi:hypothetical protein
MVKHWGQYLWSSFNVLSLSLRNNDKGKKFEEYMNLMCSFLPCKNCEKHFKHLLCEFPFELTYKYKHPYLVWSNLAHNIVNDRIHKKQYDFYKLHNELCNCEYMNNTNNDNLERYDRKYKYDIIFDALYIYSLQLSNNDNRELQFYRMLLLLPSLICNTYTEKSSLVDIIKKMCKHYKDAKHKHFTWIYNIQRELYELHNLNLPHNYKYKHIEFCDCDDTDKLSESKYNYFCPIE